MIPSTAQRSACLGSVTLACLASILTGCAAFRIAPNGDRFRLTPTTIQAVAVEAPVNLLPFRMNSPCPFDSNYLTSQLHEGLTGTHLFSTMGISQPASWYTIVPTLLGWAPAIDALTLQVVVQHAGTSNTLYEVRLECRGLSRVQAIGYMRDSMSIIGTEIAQAITAFEAQHPVRAVTQGKARATLPVEANEPKLPLRLDPDDIVARLQQLKELKASGALTQEEYETQRKVLVKKL